MKNAPFYKATLRQITGCIFFMSVFFPAVTRAQTRGTVEVVKDARIDTFANRRANLKGDHSAVVTARTNAFGSRVDGYRVQIFSGTNRKDAYDTQARFKTTHADTHTYIIYNEPNYKVRAGDFRTHLEAEKLMQDLKGSYTGLFIMDEKVNIYKADTPND
jgi:hypothetical protein